MSIPISKSEVDAVMAELLLGGEGDDPESAARDLAKRAIHAFLPIRESRPGYGWVEYQNSEARQIPFVHEQWATLESARKHPPEGLVDSRAFLVKFHRKAEA